MQYDSYSQEETHMVQAIVGANWGDEGKGKITDMLAEKADDKRGFKCQKCTAFH